MKCLIRTFCISLLFTMINNSLWADHIITFFIRPYPIPEISNNKDNTLPKELTEHCKLTKRLVKNQLIQPTNVGIFATYAGYIARSDNEGQITFPRKTKQAQLTILVTPTIEPIFMIGGTIAYWRITDKSNAKMYIISRYHDDEIWYWETEDEALPADGDIPLHTITILADPESFYIPLGATYTTANPQLLLPDMYAKPCLDPVEHAPYVISIKQFFSPINTIYKKEPTGYAIDIKRS